MNQDHLLQDEKVITKSKEGSTILTNYRIQYSDKKWGKAYTSSILLKNISAIEINYRSNVLLLIVAALSFFGVLMVGEGLILGISISTIFLLIFLLTRRHYVSISSNGSVKINLLIKGMKSNKVLEFLNKIEQAIIDNDALGISERKQQSKNQIVNMQ